MEYPLYELYSQSLLSLYDVRKHFLVHFYYKKHSRNDVEKILRIVVGSSKIGELLKESAQKKAMPTCEDFLTTICSILRLMFKSNETQALVAMDSALRWDIEVNRELNLCTSEELREEVIKVFKKYSIYGNMTEEEINEIKSIPVIEVKAEENTEETKELPKYIYAPQLKTWSLDSFLKDFGRLYVKEYANKETGDLFKTCVFVKGRTRTFVAFSSKLGVLTRKEIDEMKEDLVVVQLPTGKYCLARSEGGAR